MHISPHAKKLTNLEPGCLSPSPVACGRSPASTCQGTASSLVPSHLCPGLHTATWSCSSSLGVKAQILSSAHQALPDLPRPFPSCPSSLSPVLILLHTPRSPSGPPTWSCPRAFAQLCPQIGAPPQPSCCLCPKLDPCSHLSPGLRAASSQAPHPLFTLCLPHAL